MTEDGVVPLTRNSEHRLRRNDIQQLVRQGVVVMGNAAHALHPVAGQGFNLALRDVVEQSEHLLFCCFVVDFDQRVQVLDLLLHTV